MKIRKGYRKQRVARPKEKDVPATYDSKWEHTLHQGVLKNWQHHSDTVDYTVEHKYHPDFIKVIGNKTILLEYTEINQYLKIYINAENL